MGERNQGLRTRDDSAEIVICGAGSAGVGTAYYLAVEYGIRNIVVVDEAPPLSQTNVKKDEIFSGWWPSFTMDGFANRGIRLLQDVANQTDNYFNMQWPGQLYVSKRSVDSAAVQSYLDLHQTDEGGEPRYHDALTPQGIKYRQRPVDPFKLSGVDILCNPRLIRHHFPHLAEDIQVVIHPRHGGVMDGNKLLHYMWQQAQAFGVRYVPSRVAGVEQDVSGVTAVHVEAGETFQRISTRVLINAAGQNAAQIANLLAVKLPLETTLQQKVVLPDSAKVVPRGAPPLTFVDAQRLPWSAEEHEKFHNNPKLNWLIDALQGGLQVSPIGGEARNWLALMWEGKQINLNAEGQPKLSRIFPQLVLRGACVPIPEMRGYRPIPNHLLHHVGIYQTKTAERLPLVGPLGVEGSYVISALAEVGMTGVCASAELLARYITKRKLPSYAADLSPERYQHPQLVKAFAARQMQTHL